MNGKGRPVVLSGLNKERQSRKGNGPHCSYRCRRGKLGGLKPSFYTTMLHSRALLLHDPTSSELRIVSSSTQWGESSNFSSDGIPKKFQNFPFPLVLMKIIVGSISFEFLFTFEKTVLFNILFAQRDVEIIFTNRSVTYNCLD